MDDPIGAFEQTRDFYLSYLETAFRIRDSSLTSERRRLLERPGTLCTAPLVEPIPRYALSGFRVDELARDVSDDSRLPGFRHAERLAFADLVLGGLFESQPEPKSLLGRLAVHELYEHQAQMLARGVQAGMPCVVTTGTGSGKTEAFLLPVLAMLTREALSWPEADPRYLATRWWQDTVGQPYSSWTAVPGRPLRRAADSSPYYPYRQHERRAAAVRALVLYPMNALVEDQLVRLRKALDSELARAAMSRHFRGNRLFLGRYTSATPVTGHHRHPRPSPEEYKRRDRQLQRLFAALCDLEETQTAARLEGVDSDARFLFPSADGGELPSRWDMQAHPPDILITNVSMLSAMLAREVEAPMFAATRSWLTSNDESYFFLILDELHLQRGSAGTEVSYLLRVLLERLGLADPQHRHKLRILASSASLPTDGAAAEKSLAFLFDMFGGFGLTSSRGSTDASPADWRAAILVGRTLQEQPAGLHILATNPYIALLDTESSREGVATLRQPEATEDLWRGVAKDLLGKIDTQNLGDLAGACVREAAARLAMACWSAQDERSRATATTELAQSLFGRTDAEGLRALRALLIVRAAGDHLKDWYGSGVDGVPTFRIHTFFRSIEGLFATALATPDLDGAVHPDHRPVGTLSVERGLQFVPDGSGSRLFELLYCECCGELFFGGMRGKRSGSEIELLPSDPDIDGLPDSAATTLFEGLSHEQFAVFWPRTGRTPPECHFGKWRPAALEPRAGLIRVTGALPGRERRYRRQVVIGYIYHRAAQDDHRRASADAGTAVPYECPACGSDYHLRRAFHRLSPLRSFRTGFAKTTQLLASELFGRVQRAGTSGKLISFSDSRQDAAKAALDIEGRHHEDVRRELLVSSLRSVAATRRTRADLEGSRRKLGEELGQLIAGGRYEEVEALQHRLAAINAAVAGADDPAIPLAQVLEVDPLTFLGPRQGREGLKPYLAGFVRLGIHPTDLTGTRGIRTNDPQKRYDWTELFVDVDGTSDWRDDPVERSRLDEARQALVSAAHSLVGEVIFSKTYFSLEETGLAYPTVRLRPGMRREDYECLTAFLRVFTDAYRLQENVWGVRPLPWMSARDIRQGRVRAFAAALWGPAAMDQRLDEVLRGLGEAGHPQGIITMSSVALRLVDGDDGFWRCGQCSRVHLHHGAGFCTRCAARLSDAPTGSVGALRLGNFLAKRVERPGGSFRLHCEELTGQTDAPLDRQRRFKGVLLGSMPPVLARRELIDLLAVTTTMEVGVDIGPLQAIFQANMPPQRFNYQQRVGRAGRRQQAFSIVLTVCRSKSHDLHYFRHPEQITGELPPPPFLSKTQALPARRFVRKAWLGRAFSILRDQCAANGERYPGDDLSPPDVHGEYVPTDRYFELDSIWPDRLRSALAETRTVPEAIAAILAEDSPLSAAIVTDGLDVASVLQEIGSIPSSEGRVREAGLAHTLAESGLLPMYGMPTRVRNLYTGLDWRRSADARASLKWQRIDRDLDYAIHEFAPGSIIVKDKRQHRCVGFTGPLPEVRLGRSRSPSSISPLAPALSDPFWLIECTECGGLSRFDSAPQDEACSCGAILEPPRATECRTPSGFRTDFEPEPIDDSELALGRHRSVSAEARRINFQPVAGTNMGIALQAQVRTYRLNRGLRDDTPGATGWRGFSLREGSQRLRTWTLTEQCIADEERVPNFTPDPHAAAIERIWIAAPKTTDALFVAPQAIHAGLGLHRVGSAGHRDTAVRAAAISATFLIALRAALDLDIDPEEFDVIEPRLVQTGGGLSVPVLQIADHLVNGAGFCEELARHDGSGRPRFAGMLSSMLNDVEVYPLADFLPSPHPETCRGACYLCLHRYGNRAYHGLLDWRLGIAFLRSLLEPAFACGLDGRFDSAPELRDWPALAHGQAEDMTRYFSSDGGEVVMVGALPAFRFDRRRDDWALVVHPLWSRDPPQGLLAKAIEEFQGGQLTPVDTFNLARRPVFVRERLLESWLGS